MILSGLDQMGGEMRHTAMKLHAAYQRQHRGTDHRSMHHHRQYIRWFVRWSKVSYRMAEAMHLWRAEAQARGENDA